MVISDQVEVNDASILSNPRKPIGKDERNRVLVEAATAFEARES